MKAASERERTAYHEAGHWVIGDVFGYAHGGVSIEPDEERGTLGHVVPLEGPETFYYEDGLIPVERVEGWVCSYYAGFAADVRLSPETEETARQGASDDDEKAEALPRTRGPRDGRRSPAASRAHGGARGGALAGDRAHRPRSGRARKSR